MSWIPSAVAVWEKISSSSKILTWLYSRPYRGVLENEITLAGLHKNDIILNIGCGAVPFTALYLATLVGAKVYAVDIDPMAVRLAGKCVEKAGLSHRIKVIEKDGAKTFDFPFTASVIALQAAPKRLILDAVKKAALPGARFIFRLPSSPYKDHYESLSTDLPPRAISPQPMRTFDRSVLYVNA